MICTWLSKDRPSPHTKRFPRGIHMGILVCWPQVHFFDTDKIGTRYACFLYVLQCCFGAYSGSIEFRWCSSKVYSLSPCFIVDGKACYFPYFGICRRSVISAPPLLLGRPRFCSLLECSDLSGLFLCSFEPKVSSDPSPFSYVVLPLPSICHFPPINGQLYYTACRYWLLDWLVPLIVRRIGLFFAPGRLI